MYIAHLYTVYNIPLRGWILGQWSDQEFGGVRKVRKVQISFLIWKNTSILKIDPEITQKYSHILMNTLKKCASIYAAKREYDKDLLNRSYLCNINMPKLIYLGFYVAFNTVQSIS